MSFKAHVERLRGAPAPKRVIKTTWSRFPAKVSHSMNVSEREGERERGRERERERERESGTSTCVRTRNVARRVRRWMLTLTEE